MERFFEKYTGNKTYVSASGAIYDRERTLIEFPAALILTHIVETDSTGEMMLALQLLSRMRDLYGIDATLSEDDAIAALKEAVAAADAAQAQAAAAYVPPEERMAAALEYQNLLTM